jgi:hypothetical protein
MSHLLLEATFQAQVFKRSVLAGQSSKLVAEFKMQFSATLLVSRWRGGAPFYGVAALCLGGTRER